VNKQRRAAQNTPRYRLEAMSPPSGTKFDWKVVPDSNKRSSIDHYGRVNFFSDFKRFDDLASSNFQFPLCNL
jgi:hypothetical protein